MYKLLITLSFLSTLLACSNNPTKANEEEIVEGMSSGSFSSSSEETQPPEINPNTEYMYLAYNGYVCNEVDTSSYDNDEEAYKAISTICEEYDENIESSYTIKSIEQLESTLYSLELINTHTEIITKELEDNGFVIVYYDNYNDIASYLFVENKQIN